MDFTVARQNMVECQLRTSGIVDESVLEAMGTIPRELFVPGDRAQIAYIDEDIALDNGRCLMEPCVLGRLLQAAGVGPADVVLDIGCGTGYAAAVLARLAATVFALECTPALAARAGDMAAELGLDNVVPVDGDLAAGCAAHAPYNVILFEGAVGVGPQVIIDQLADDGRLVAVVRGDGVGRAMVLHRTGDHVSRRPVFDASTPAMPEFASTGGFVF
jgi:protein-L-isoaspartate(D-aspartate) O-methyltransferase